MRRFAERPLVVLIAIGLSYAAGSRLAFTLSNLSGLQAVLFVPAGITLAALVRLPTRLWWAVLTGAALAEIALDLGYGLRLAPVLGFAAANVLEPLVAATLIRRHCPDLDLARRQDLAWFLCAGVVLGPAVGALVGTIAGGVVGDEALVDTLWQWWLGDALGVVLVGAPLLALGSGPDRRPIASPEGAVLLVGVGALSLGLALTHLPLQFLALVGVVIAGVRFGLRAVTATALVSTVTLAVHLVTHDATLVTGLSSGTALAVVKLQLGVSAVAGLLVAAEAYDREQAVLAAQATEVAIAEEQRTVEHLQRLLLPPSRVDGTSFTAIGSYRAGRPELGVGGDWYDVVDPGGGRVVVSVGDVVGSGAPAAAVMGRLRLAIGVLAGDGDGHRGDDCGELLRRLDRLSATDRAALCTTVFVARFDPERRLLSYAAAGHPPGFLHTRSGGLVRLDGARSRPLGLEPAAPRPSTEVPVTEDAVLVLCTDGLIERRDECIDDGLARLEASLRRTFASEEPAPSAVLADLDDGDARDDAVLLWVTLRPAPPEA